MKVNFLDNDKHLEFAPLTLLKPVAKLWMGGFTLEDRWKCFWPKMEIGYRTSDYLSEKNPALENPSFEIVANAIASKSLVDFLETMPSGKLMYKGQFIAQKGNSTSEINYNGELVLLQKRWDFYLLNHAVLLDDFKLLTKNKKSEKISETNTIIGDPKNVFIAPNARVEAAILNVSDGPIYIGSEAEIMEGSLVRGPLFLGDHAALKMGAKIYGGTTIAPFSKVGGEVGNSVFQAFSNKGHDGYLGNSLIGEWCNLGADTNSSNLKNNYGFIRTHNFVLDGEEQTNQQFMGLTMGDHSKCGINTMFNTATVVGISANIYGGDFPKKFIPSFSWGGQDWEKFNFEKALEAASNMMIRRGKKLDEGDIRVWKHLYDM